MTFIGIDPSLTAPGFCAMDVDAQVQEIRTVRTKAKGQARSNQHAAWFGTRCRDLSPCLVSFEGYSFGSNMQGYAARIELVGAIKYWLEDYGVPFVPIALATPPSTLKKYMLGHGGGGGDEGKRQMVEAVRSRGVKVLDDNQADAYGLALILRDAWRYAIKGVRPETIYRFEQVKKLETWIKQHAKGVAA